MVEQAYTFQNTLIITTTSISVSTVKVDRRNWNAPVISECGMQSQDF